MRDRTHGSISRRQFAYLLSAGGSAALLAHPGMARLVADGRRSADFAAPTSAEDDAQWRAVRQQFLMPADFHLFNAANLCPAPEPVLKAVADHTRRMDATPSPAVRDEMLGIKATTRKKIAEFLGVTADEIIMTRNTSEANNFVSSGLDLRAGDEVVLMADNHPSNLAAWQNKAKRFGYTVKMIEQPNPHPGPEYYLDAVRKALTPQTKVLAFGHVTSTVGDLLPAKALCAMARERGVLTLLDGAQSFGALDVNLRDIDPDFYAGSAHKWPCGPLEAGVLFVNTRSHSRIWPSILSAYAGDTGISKTHEALGQRDEPTLLAFGEALTFQQKVGRAAIEQRIRTLSKYLVSELRKIDGVTMWTSTDPSRTTSVVSLLPGTLDPHKLGAYLFEKHGIVCAIRGGADRGGLRFSPHLYNSMEEMDGIAAALKGAMRQGV